MTNRDRPNSLPSGEGTISIVGPGTRVIGDVETEGTVRIEGSVEGTVRAGKAVVIGKEGMVEGDVRAHDAVVAGRVVGTVVAESRLELQASGSIQGDVYAQRLHLEEGASLNGSVQMGDFPSPVVPGLADDRSLNTARIMPVAAGQGS